jgi:hypothetical protein
MRDSDRRELGKFGGAERQENSVIPDLRRAKAGTSVTDMLLPSGFCPPCYSIFSFYNSLYVPGSLLQIAFAIPAPILQ